MMKKMMKWPGIECVLYIMVMCIPKRKHLQTFPIFVDDHLVVRAAFGNQQKFMHRRPCCT